MKLYSQTVDTTWRVECHCHPRNEDLWWKDTYQARATFGRRRDCHETAWGQRIRLLDFVAWSLCGRCRVRVLDARSWRWWFLMDIFGLRYYCQLIMVCSLVESLEDLTTLMEEQLVDPMSTQLLTLGSTNVSFTMGPSRGMLQTWWRRIFAPELVIMVSIRWALTPLLGIIKG